MDDLLRAAETAGYSDFLGCLESVFRDLGISSFEKLEDLPGLRNGRTTVCGKINVYRLIADIKQGLLDIIENSQTIEDRQIDDQFLLSFDEEE